MSNLVKLNKEFLSGKVEAGIEVTPPATDADVVAAFAHDTSFPYRQIELGQITAKAQTGDLKFGDGAAQVTFKGSASALAGLGIYPDPERLLTALDIHDNLAPGLNLNKDPESLYLALRWGYDLEASAKGSIALGAPGAITLSATGKREALYAVIRRLDKDTGALTAVEKVAKSWMLPSQIDGLDDLEPGTWLIAEVDGSVALSLGVQYGYDFNWVREAQLLGLSGDIGLRLQMGISAALSFNASGNFAVVVSRDPQDAADQMLRFRLFRLRQKGWGFAFNAGASVQADFDDFLPEFDEFVKAIFGVHGAQVLKDLKAIEKWTNPNQSLEDILGEVSVDYAWKFLEQVTGINPEQAFNQARDRLVSFIDKWNALPHSIATRVWKLVEKSEDLAGIRRLAETIRDANMDTVKKPVADLLADVDFFRTPAGAWLVAAAAKGIFNAINSTNEFAVLQDAARKTLEILDGSTFEGVLEKLQTYIEEHLNLEKYLKLGKLEDLFGINSLQDLDQASFDKIDEWLKARLSAFLGERLNLAKLNEIRQSIFLFIKRGRAFYDKTLKALSRKYEFNFAYTFQSSTTRTALLDFTLDFTHPNVIDALKLALSGRYDDLLVQQTPGVKLNLGTLTHQIARTSHVEINLPWYKSAVDHINTSLAKVNAVDESDGRLFIYELDAKDIVEEKNKRQSRLAVGGFLKAQVNQVRVFSTDELTYSYTFRQVKKNMKRADLQYQLKPYVETYFDGVFKPLPNGDGTFENFIGDMDNLIDKLEFNGTDNFGNTLIGLDIGLPAATASAWLKAPAKPSGGPKVQTYLSMSRRLQAKMREILPLSYFADLDHFGDITPAATLLVYSAMPPSTWIRRDGNSWTIDLDKDYYWDYVDRDYRRAMIRHPLTNARLSIILERVYNLLRESGMTGTAGFFKPDRAALIQNEVAGDNAYDNVLRSLLIVENEIVEQAREAGYEIAKYTAVSNMKPSEAVKALAKFGSKLTSAFNENIKSIYGGAALRPLGTAMFIEAASVLSPGIPSKATALLDLTVLKKGSAFEMPKYLDGDLPAKGDILVQERILNIS
ncbi:MAG: hypothetical protein WCB68_09540 [Pyrinomonadaceae bacterium]